MLCRQENIVQIARFVILGADRRSRLRCQRWQTLAFDLVSTHYVSLYFSNKIELGLNIGLKIVEV